MALSYSDALTRPERKRSKREDLLRLALQLFSLSMSDKMDEAGFDHKDGTGPELYVAPRYSPSP